MIWIAITSLFLIVLAGWSAAENRYRKERRAHLYMKQELHYAWKRIGDLEDQCHH
jgi:hypothetical protein